MKRNLLLCLGTFILGVSIMFIFKLPQRFFAKNEQPEVKTQCEYQKDSETFSKKFYFSREEANALFGKKIRNLKCGKIKCPLRANNCSNVEIGETGRISSLKPRQGFSDYTVIIEWDTPQKVLDRSLAEQGLDTFVTYIGNDGTFEVVE